MSEDEPAPENTSERAKPSGKGEDKPPETPQFRFDRYGRRIGKRARYGKRKNAPRAATTVVEHDTEAKREYDEARKRSEARAKRRAREEAKAAELKKAERKEKWRRSTATFVLGVLALAALVALTWFTTRLSKIEITNVPRGYTEERIIELSGLEPSLHKKSALLISTQKVEDRIEQDPYLEATVRYSFPAKIRITLNRRDEAACVRWGPQNEYIAIIDSKGIVLNTEAETTGGLIVAEGLSITAAQAGRALGDMTDLQIASLIRILSKLEELDLLRRSPRLSRIDMSEMMNISISTEGAPYSIEVGDSANLDTKLGLLQKHWDQIMQSASRYISEGYSTATIYLYTKGGVSVSPYEPGYNLAMTPINNYALPSGDAVVVTPAPITGDNPEETPDPDAPAPETPTPAPTPMPHQGGTFTG
jgi:cell division septal protein FtsQ